MKNNLKNKKTGQKSCRLLSGKAGQEEMVGFGLILILVAVIFIVVISVYIKKSSEPVVDYESNSFIQSVLQYTTECEESNLENLSVQELIFQCQEKDPCEYRNMDPCKILNDTLRGIIRESWEVNSKTPVKGYFFIINISNGIDEEQFVNLTKGVVTKNYRGSEQDFFESGVYVKILFNVYS